MIKSPPKNTSLYKYDMRGALCSVFLGRPPNSIRLVISIKIQINKIPV